MSYKTVLAIIGKSLPNKDLDQLIDQAYKMEMHLSILILGVAPPPPVYSYGFYGHGTMVQPNEWKAMTDKEAKILKKKAKEIEKSFDNEGISGEVSTLYCTINMVEDEVAAHALISDLAFVPNNLSLEPNIYDRALAGILFKSPIGLIAADKTETVPLSAKKVFVAWNNGLEAARALHQALPILKQADEVLIGVFDPIMTRSVDGEDPGADVALWLSRHGCEVTVQQYPSGGKEIGTCIPKRAKEVGADLIVMGAYGHSRLRERIFGGTTFTMLEQTSLPVFFAH